MDKKIKFSEQPTKVKIVYGVVVGILIVTAIIVGIVSVASRKPETPGGSENPPINDGGNGGTEEQPGGTTDTDNGNSNGGEGDGNQNAGGEGEKLSFVSPVVGSVSKYHSTEIPVFSNTLNEWRIHTGIDISAEEGSDVYAVADGVVSKVFADPFHGRTVEITHASGVVSRYSNLAAEGISVKEGDEVKSGAKIGVIGDTSLSELADEPHLHFEVKVGEVSVNPLDYISEESKSASLGIGEI